MALAAATRSSTALGRVRSGFPKGRTLPPELWERRHDRIVALLWLHVAGIIVLGMAFGLRPLHAAAHGAALIPFALFAQVGSRRFRSAAASIGLLTSSALLVHIAHGSIEAHFHFFLMIAVLALYEDWVPFGLAVAYVGLHHGVFGALYPHSVYDHPNAGGAAAFQWAGIHVLFVLGAAVINVITWRMNEELRARTRIESSARARAEAIAGTLEQSLRPARLPDLAYGSVQARYRPSAGSEIGGDWYDVLTLDNGRIALALGDVAGTGVPAATLTSRLRHSFAAYALEGLAPREIAERLERLFEGEFATLVCCLIDPASGTLTYSNLGHMPPLLVTSDGAEFLTLVAPPLGAELAAVAGEESVAFGPGCALVVYTDGLVERRDQPLQERLDLLAVAAAGARDAEPGELCDALIAAMRPDDRDDLAIVCLRGGVAALTVAEAASVTAEPLV